MLFPPEGASDAGLLRRQQHRPRRGQPHLARRHHGHRRAGALPWRCGSSCSAPEPASPCAAWSTTPSCAASPAGAPTGPRCCPGPSVPSLAGLAGHPPRRQPGIAVPHPPHPARRQRLRRRAVRPAAEPAADLPRRSRHRPGRGLRHRLPRPRARRSRSVLGIDDRPAALAHRPPAGHPDHRPVRRAAVPAPAAGAGRRPAAVPRGDPRARRSSVGCRPSCPVAAICFGCRHDASTAPHLPARPGPGARAS